MRCGHDTCACDNEHHNEALHVLTDTEDGCGCDHDHGGDERRGLDEAEEQTA
jgi:hypothetical protein